MLVIVKDPRLYWQSSSLIIFMHPHAQVQVNYSLRPYVFHALPPPRPCTCCDFRLECPPSSSSPILLPPYLSNPTPTKMAHKISPCFNLTYSSKFSSNVHFLHKAFLESSLSLAISSLNFSVSYCADVGYSGRERLWLQGLGRKGGGQSGSECVSGGDTTREKSEKCVMKGCQKHSLTTLCNFA